MSTIFISHSSKDNQIAEELERRLDRWGHHSVFLDLDPEKGIGAGQSWERTLYRKLRACRAVIAVCTDNYLSSRWCFAELALARMEGKHIISILADPLSLGSVLPSIMTDRQCVDFRANVEEGYERLWRGLKEMDLLGLVGEWDPTTPPYLGLNAYQEEHAPIFFGREKESQAGVELLERGTPNMVMVLGASGSGKSSLVRAGILPLLRRDEDRWLVIEPLRPGRDPFAELAASLAHTYRRYAPDHALSVKEYLGRVIDTKSDPAQASSPPPLVELADDLRRVSGRREARVLLVVDQFEELLARDGDHAKADDFLALLRASFEAENSPVMVLGTMRSSFLEAFQRNAALRGIDFESLSLAPMKVDGMRRVIEEPAKLAAIELEMGLSDRLLKDTETPDALPLLSFTLSALWHDRGHAGELRVLEYDKLGGLHGAVSREADALLAIARKDQREDMLRQAFVEMARVTEEGSYARQPVCWDDDNIRPVKAILERFVERRLLVSRMEGETQVVEVAHEALFRSWKPLKTWLDDARADLTLEQQIRRDAMVWNESNRASDNLWRGGRLQQADEFSRKRDLREVEREFVRAGVKRKQRQRKMLAGTAISAFFVLAVALGFALWSADQARRERAHALDLARVSIASSEMTDNPTRAALVLLEVDNWDLMRLNLTSEVVCGGRSVSVLGGHEDRVSTAAFNPDGTRVVTASLDGTARIWDSASGRLLHVLRGHEDRVLGAAFSPDGGRVVTASSDSRAKIWDADTGRLVHVLTAYFDIISHIGDVYGAVFSPDGTRLLTASYDRTARIWDAETGRPLHLLRGHEDRVRTAVFSPDGTRVATASFDDTARIWDAETGRQLPVLRGHESDVWSAVFSPNGRRVVTASDDGTARIWNAETGRLLHVLRGHEGGVLSAVFSPDGTRVATACRDGTARIWDARTGRLLHVLRGHEEGVCRAAFSPDGTRVATASFDDTARVWDAETGQLLYLIHGHEHWVVSAVFSPDGTRILTASFDGTGRLWYVGDGQPLHVLRGHESDVLSAVFSPDGRSVVSVSADDTARIWDAKTGQSLHVLSGHESDVTSAVFSPDGTRVVTASDDNTAMVWDAETGRLLYVLRGHGDRVYSAVFSPDGTRVVTASDDDTARIWDVGNGQPLHVLKGDSYSKGSVLSPDGTRVLTFDGFSGMVWDAESGQQLHVLHWYEGVVQSAAFSPDGKRVVTASSDDTARIWDAESGQQLSVLRGHEGDVSTAAFNPDGTRVVTASDDRTARIWDAESGQQIRVLHGHMGVVLDAVFSPDGTRVVTSDSFRTRIWDAGSGQPLYVLRGHADRVYSATLSPDGTRVVTASRDGTARIWPLTRDGLERMVRANTSVCLSPEFRRYRLGESEEEAWDNYEKCEREQGRTPGPRNIVER